MDETKLGVNELAEIATARAAFSAFLTIHFNELPDEKFAKQMRRKQIASMLELLAKDASTNEDIAAGASLMYDYLQSTREDSLAQLSEKLGVDRTRLYRGLSPNYGPPPPYEMVWSKTWHDVGLLQELAGTYREQELTPSTELVDRLDYAGLELEFLHALAVREAAAWEAGKTKKAASLLEVQKKFVKEHLEQWVPDFVQKALEYVKTDFYHGHLLMLRGFIAEQKEIFSTVT